jgi:hypothetical protein
MKNTPIVPQLPDPPLRAVDLSETLPEISQDEIVVLANAFHHFRIALADYEMKRAAVTLKLLQLCTPEPGSYNLELNRSGGLILTDETSIPVERIILGEGDSHRPFLE